MLSPSWRIFPSGIQDAYINICFAGKYQNVFSVGVCLGI